MTVDALVRKALFAVFFLFYKDRISRYANKKDDCSVVIPPFPKAMMLPGK